MQAFCLSSIRTKLRTITPNIKDSSPPVKTFDFHLVMPNGINEQVEAMRCVS